VTEIIFDNHRIIKYRPDLKGKLCVFTMGNYGIVRIFENEVIKEPRIFLGEKNDFSQEINNMEAIKEAGISFAPNLLSTSRDKSFYSMQKMPGVKLSGVFDQLSPIQKNAIAEEIANCKLDIEKKLEKRNLLVSSDDNLFKRAEAQLQLPDTKADIEKYGTGIYEILVEYVSDFHKRKPIAVHGDLHDENILVEPSTVNISGIVDWASTKKNRAYEEELYRLSTYSYAKEIDYKFSQNILDIYCDKKQIDCKKTDLACFIIAERLNFCDYGDQKYNVYSKVVDALKLCSEPILYLHDSVKISQNKLLMR
jgi:hypothetical protein